MRSRQKSIVDLPNYEVLEISAIAGTPVNRKGINVGPCAWRCRDDISFRLLCRCMTSPFAPISTTMRRLSSQRRREAKDRRADAGSALRDFRGVAPIEFDMPQVSPDMRPV